MITQGDFAAATLAAWVKMAMDKEITEEQFVRHAELAAMILAERNDEITDTFGSPDLFRLGLRTVTESLADANEIEAEGTRA